MTPVGFDLSTSVVEALVRDNSGAFTAYPGQGNADGTFSTTDGNRAVTVFSKPTLIYL